MDNVRTASASVAVQLCVYLGIGPVRYCGILVLLVAASEIAAAQTVPLPPPRPALPATPPPRRPNLPPLRHRRPASSGSRRSWRLRPRCPTLTARAAAAPRTWSSSKPSCSPTRAASPSRRRRWCAAIWRRRWRTGCATTWRRRCGRLGPLRGDRQLRLLQCRGRNRVAGAKLSEHGKANAIDIRSFKLANGKLIELTSVEVDKELRESLKRSTCARFTTVLGPGSDGYHEDHVHVDLAERRSGYRICQWDVRDKDEKPAPGPDAVQIPLPRPRPFAAASTRYR